jgi:hypothetical protein
MLKKEKELLDCTAKMKLENYRKHRQLLSGNKDRSYRFISQSGSQVDMAR